MSRTAVGFLILVTLLIAGTLYARHELRVKYAPRLPAAVAAPAPGTSPLDRVLTPQQVAAFTNATGALARLEYFDALPLSKAVPPARTACAALDPAVPLLAALRDTCEPELRIAAPARRARSLCPNEARWRACVKTLHIRADALRSIAQAQRSYARVVHRAMPPGDCRWEISPVHDVVVAFEANARATDQYAAAVAAHDNAAEKRARARISDAADISDDDLVYDRRRTIAKACHLPAWAFDAR